MGPKYRSQAVSDFERLVRDYPLSARAEDAKQQLQDLEVPIPEANRVAYDRQKYNEENFRRPSMLAGSMGMFFHGPDVAHASKTGQPSMQDLAFPIPASVPKANNNVEAAAGGSGAGTTDIQGGVVQDPAKLNQGAHAREATPKPAASQTQGEAIPSNHDADIKKARELQAKRAKKYKKKRGRNRKFRLRLPLRLLSRRHKHSPQARPLTPSSLTYRRHRPRKPRPSRAGRNSSNEAHPFSGRQPAGPAARRADSFRSGHSGRQRYGRSYRAEPVG